jgi:archaellin
MDEPRLTDDADEQLTSQHVCAEQNTGGMRKRLKRADIKVVVTTSAGGVAVALDKMERVAIYRESTQRIITYDQRRNCSDRERLR